MSSTVPTVSRSSTTRTTPTRRRPRPRCTRSRRASGAGRRTVAVLGYLAELGDYERDGHEEVGRLAATLGVDRLIVVGESAAPIHDGAAGGADWGGESVLVTDQAAAIERAARSGCGPATSCW